MMEWIEVVAWVVGYLTLGGLTALVGMYIDKDEQREAVEIVLACIILWPLVIAMCAIIFVLAWMDGATVRNPFASKVGAVSEEGADKELMRVDVERVMREAEEINRERG